MLNDKSILKLISYTIAAATIVTGSNVISVSAGTVPVITEAGD